MVSSFGENYKKLMIGSSSGSTIRAKFTCFDGLTKGSNVISAIIISCRRSLKEDVVSSTNEIKKSIGLGFCFPYLILILYGIKLCSKHHLENIFTNIEFCPLAPPFKCIFTSNKS